MPLQPKISFGFSYCSGSRRVQLDCAIAANGDRKSTATTAGVGIRAEMVPGDGHTGRGAVVQILARRHE
jgi:hypothetical protein